VLKAQGGLKHLKTQKRHVVFSYSYPEYINRQSLYQ
jgi:hypothetical protein